ncbi:MAG: ABC transporter ATP-binding protein [Lachnospiraceae bacterium]|nr:ABC transporter ATP-binding protein [Lachnospiraceae bacterium]
MGAAGEGFYFHTEGLAVGYQKTPLIRDIGLSLRRGEILTLIGPNGAGKTTILRSIIRQLEPLGGLVFLDGKELGKWPAGELAARLSVVLTERIRAEGMTCQEVVETGRYPYTGRFGKLSGRDHMAVREAMELVHANGLAGEAFGRISDGQRQRVMLARALCQEPELIVLDEPTSYLDIRHKLEFLSLLQKLARERNLSVVLSMHELDLAERISDKVACIRGDKVDRFGPPEEVFTPGYINSLYQISTGSYEERTGTPELPPAKGRPQIFVLSGAGSGIFLYRRLQRQGIPFAAGILWENDQEYPVARALASEIVSERAFCRVREESVRRAKQLMDGCQGVICTLDPGMGSDFYPELAELAEYGRQLQSPLGFNFLAR